jgi:hypothetical protein
VNDDHLREEFAREERSVVALALVMAVLFVACFGVIHASPGLPAQIQESLACLPSLPLAQRS